MIALALTVYVRREPTTDPDLQQPGPNHRDWVFYHDAKATKPYCRIPWHYTGPTRRNRWQTLNCYRYRLVWLPDTN
jgi:hypothetical protein